MSGASKSGRPFRFSAFQRRSVAALFSALLLTSLAVGADLYYTKARRYAGVLTDVDRQRRKKEKAKRSGPPRPADAASSQRRAADREGAVLAAPHTERDSPRS
eukprot:Selendium_serpulae@DN2935_c1_g1_i1.p2